MSSVEARELLDSMDGASDVVGLRDRAIVAVMAFTFARVSAVVGLEVEDYAPHASWAWFCTKCSHSLWPGLAIGLITAWSIQSSIKSFLFGVRAADPTCSWG